MIKRVSNICIAVKDADATANTYRRLFGLEKEKELEIPEAGVKKSILLRVGKNIFFEIMEPTEADGPLKRFVDKRGEGLFQITLVVDDIDKEAEELERKGAKVMKWTIDSKNEVTPAYVNPKYTSGVVFELITEALLDKWGIGH